MRRIAVPARLVLPALVVAGAAAAWRWRGAFDPAALATIVTQSPLAAPAFLALHLAASLLFVPRTMLAFAAGLVFGMWWGVLWAALGSVLGAVAGFALARYVHAGLHAKLLDNARSAQLARMLGRVDRGGWRMVAILRLVPVIPHSLTNYALGLTGLRLDAYAFGSLIGQLPLTIAYVDLGAAGGRALIGGAGWVQAMLWPSLIGAAALALSLLIPAVARRRLGEADSATRA